MIALSELFIADNSNKIIEFDGNWSLHEGMNNTIDSINKLHDRLNTLEHNFDSKDKTKKDISENNRQIISDLKAQILKLEIENEEKYRRLKEEYNNLALGMVVNTSNNDNDSDDVEVSNSYFKQILKNGRV